MPPKNKYTRETVIATALQLVREKGADALTARALAAELGSSAKPIFGLFKNMEEVQKTLIDAAAGEYAGYLRREVERGLYPTYKASGMAYIRFAKEERELFKLLFMRDRSEEEKVGGAETEPLLDLLQEKLGWDRQRVYIFHLETWIFVHGMASMIATEYLEWDTEFVSRALTDCYMGLKKRFEEEIENEGHSDEVHHETV